jgi:OOP family OmpA-OmpF porin
MNLAEHRNHWIGITMNHVPGIKPCSLVIACALALGVSPGAAQAQANSDRGYVTGSDRSVARSGFGLCWRAGSNPDAQSINECDPKVVPAPIAQVVEPEPKAVEPVSPPVAVAPTPVAAPPAIERVTLDANALFDFDSSALRPEGRAALDAFVDQVKAVEPETISAVGHTDRIGSDAYNQHLSESRVNAVKDYLVTNGVASSRVHTEGKGESEPVTTGACDGASNATVIACLQPDRRVVLEVVGNRITK